MKWSRIGIVFFLSCLIFSFLAPSAMANAAEPSGIIIIAAFPPDDMKVSLRFPNADAENEVELKKTQKAWEAQYKYYYSMTDNRLTLEHVILVVSSAEKSFEYQFPENSFEKYSNIYTLDFKNETVTDGLTLGRSISLIAMRMILTFIIEGLIFFAFGFRSKRSWRVFLIVNLITQGALNITLNGSPDSGYIMFALILFEIIIFIFELLAFCIYTKEQKGGKTVAFVLLANLLSLVLGGALITYLPV